MRRELYRIYADPQKTHRARLKRRKPTAQRERAATAPQRQTFLNISQEQKHGRGPRR